MSLPSTKVPIQSTAGAIPIRNEKGEFTMEKVKVQRYISGKRPIYAPHDSSDSEEEVEFGKLGQKKASAALPILKTDAEKEDRRLRRLQERHQEEGEDDEVDDRILRHRRLHEPEVLAEGSESEEEGVVEKEDEVEVEVPSSEEEEEEELDEEEIERRRALLRERAKQQREDEELMDKEEEYSEEESEEESSEYEEYTDSEVEDTGPRLKPVFVRKKDRVTIQEKEKQEVKERELEIEAKRMAEERRRQTLRMVEDEARKEMEAIRSTTENFDAVNTDDDNDEEEYEAWKIRELKRIKRDREEREAVEKERLELERIHNMTEEERRAELKNNPRLVTNKASKGKYKFLQKYYHRGAFFLDEEDDVYKRDFSAPTLEDHFNKTILPKVMQVKNFGRSGRTKYTHLVDQDTTSFDSPWTDTASSHKFHAAKGGGMKQVFERPTVQKRK